MFQISDFVLHIEPGLGATTTPEAGACDHSEQLSVHHDTFREPHRGALVYAT